MICVAETKFIKNSALNSQFYNQNLGYPAMQPSFELRISTMIKALAETVLPAVDPSNRAAIEQANIVVGSLRMLPEQIDFAHWFEVKESEDLTILISEIMEISPGLAASDIDAELAVSKEIASRNDVQLSEIRACNIMLRKRIDRLIDIVFADGTSEQCQAVQKRLIDLGTAQIGRERAFVAGAGFDVFPDNLLPLAKAMTA